MPKKYLTAYICGVDWQHEIGHTNCELFSSIKALKKKRECWKYCGIVKIRIELVKWVVDQNLD